MAMWKVKSLIMTVDDIKLETNAVFERAKSGHSPGKAREFNSGEGKVRKMCSCMWSSTVSLVLEYCMLT